jgi:hypothetical protein
MEKNTNLYPIIMYNVLDADEKLKIADCLQFIPGGITNGWVIMKDNGAFLMWRETWETAIISGDLDYVTEWICSYYEERERRIGGIK